MKILVTGANGFLGKNLIAELNNKGYHEIFKFGRENHVEDLDDYTKECDFVFHLAGINRPKHEKEFFEGNVNLTKQLLDLLMKNNNNVPVVLSSTIQADRENTYGKSKKEAEMAMFQYHASTGAPVFVYRLPNLFGKWSKPNYNSVVSTFCFNIARNKSIQVNDPNIELTLCYIDDVINEFFNALNDNANKKDKYCFVEQTYKITLKSLAELIYSFKESRNNLSIPNMQDALTKKLYSTYLSYLPESDFSYNLKMNVDDRGSFTEFIKSQDRGQVSVNISKPGITKGDHWHHTKNEKFLVVSGKGVIRFRKLESEKVIEYFVSGDKLEVVDIPTGYTHNIENLGDIDMVTIMWANELFDSNNPDTYYLEV